MRDDHHKSTLLTSFVSATSAAKMNEQNYKMYFICKKICLFKCTGQSLLQMQHPVMQKKKLKRERERLQNVLEINKQLKQIAKNQYFMAKQCFCVFNFSLKVIINWSENFKCKKLSHFELVSDTFSHFSIEIKCLTSSSRAWFFSNLYKRRADCVRH